MTRTHHYVNNDSFEELLTTAQELAYVLERLANTPGLPSRKTLAVAFAVAIASATSIAHGLTSILNRIDDDLLDDIQSELDNKAAMTD